MYVKQCLISTARQKFNCYHTMVQCNTCREEKQALSSDQSIRTLTFVRNVMYMSWVCIFRDNVGPIHTKSTEYLKSRERQNLTFLCLLWRAAPELDDQILTFSTEFSVNQRSPQRATKVRGKFHLNSGTILLRHSWILGLHQNTPGCKQYMSLTGGYKTVPYS